MYLYNPSKITPSLFKLNFLRKHFYFPDSMAFSLIAARHLIFKPLIWRRDINLHLLWSSASLCSDFRTRFAIRFLPILRYLFFIKFLLFLICTYICNLRKQFFSNSGSCTISLLSMSLYVFWSLLDLWSMNDLKVLLIRNCSCVC